MLDASGCVVAPGLVDLHTHLREPGREEAETVETGARAAALGGYTAVVAMPNTEPAIDSAAVVRQVLELGRRVVLRRAGGGRHHRRAGGHAAGSDGRDGRPRGPHLHRRRYRRPGSAVDAPGDGVRLRPWGSPWPSTARMPRSPRGGHMHEGEWSSRLGIAGQPAEAEELMVMRDLALARLTGARLHFLHLSTAGSLAMVRGAKASGLAVTAEVAPHHFTLTDAEVASYDPVFKVNPPLRTAADVAAVKAALADGVVDAIATDHAPHTQEAKEVPFDQAPPGMLGLETALGLALTELDLPIEQVLALLSWQPAAIAGLDGEHGGPVAVGRPANLCVIDPTSAWVVDPAALASRSRNTPTPAGP